MSAPEVERRLIHGDGDGDVGCGYCGEPLIGQTGYTGAPAYHRECAQGVYGIEFRAEVAR